MIPDDPSFFATPADFRAWLEANHNKVQALWVGFHKKDSGQPSITWPESVDEALCFGWIDGIRKSIDATRYAVRFTPRKARSRWSTVNIDRVQALIASGAMRPEGLKAFEQRTVEGPYSYEQRNTAELDPAFEQQFRANTKAWDFFQRQPPSYRRAAIGGVISAKQDKTKASRLAQLISDSEQGRTIRPLTRPTKQG